MALIRCPECGRENVSDSAYSCPSCGYTIRDYYIKLKNEKRNEEQHKDEITSLKLEMEEKLKEIDKSHRPYKPSWNDVYTNHIEHCLCFLIFLIISILFPVYLIRDGLISYFALLASYNPFVIIFIIALELFSIFMACLFFSFLRFFYDVELKNFNDWESNKEFEKKTIRIKYEIYIDNLIKYGNRNGVESRPRISSKNKVCCPKCGSANTNEIPIVSKVISLYFLGFLSKNSYCCYKCNNCKYKW